MYKRLVALALTTLPLAAAANPEQFTLDPFHTYPNFTVEHWGFSTLHGRFDKSAGKFTLDRKARTGSVELVVDTASINTGDNEKLGRPRSRDEHLRAADFFNSAEFPKMFFKSTKVVFSGDYPSSLDGQLTLLGVTRPVTFKLDRFKCGPNPYNKKDRCGGNASGRIKRSDFGMKMAIPAVGDEITLMVEFEGEKD